MAFYVLKSAVIQDRIKAKNSPRHHWAPSLLGVSSEDDSLASLFHVALEPRPLDGRGHGGRQAEEPTGKGP